MLAVFLLIVFLVSLSYFSSVSESPGILLLMQKQADDALIIVDKNGNLATLDAPAIEETLNRTLIPSQKWNMQIEYYNYTGGFDYVGNFTFGSDYSDVDRMAIAQRNFLVFEDGHYWPYGEKDVKYYGVARLRIWTE